MRRSAVPDERRSVFCLAGHASSETLASPDRFRRLGRVILVGMAVTLGALATALPQARAASSSASAQSAATVVTSTAAQGQSALAALIASTPNGSPVASALFNAAGTNPAVAKALVNSLTVTTQVIGDPPSGPEPSSPFDTTTAPMAPFRPRRLPLAASASGSAGAAAPAAAAAAASGCHNPVVVQHTWTAKDIIAGWVITRIDGWCWSNGYITSTQGWAFPKYQAYGTCMTNEYSTHGGYGARNSNGNTAWAHGGHWATIGFKVGGSCLGPYYSATLRIAGDGYYDNYDDFGF